MMKSIEKNLFVSSIFRFLVSTSVSLVLVFSLPLYASKKNKNNDPTLSLLLNSNKSRVKIGDELELELIIKNISNEPLSVYGHKYPYETANLEILDSNGKKLEIFNKAIVDIFGYREESFTELAPSETLKLNYKVKIRKKKMYRSKKEKVAGIFADFEVNAVRFDGYGKYIIKGSWYMNDKSYFLKNEKIPNLWSGEVFSNAVEVELVKK